MAEFYLEKWRLFIWKFGRILFSFPKLIEIYIISISCLIRSYSKKKRELYGIKLKIIPDV